MRQYWAGYHGSALVMNEEEFELFKKLYAEKRGMDSERLEDVIWSEGIREVAFIRSACGQATTFKITDILRDDCDGMWFVPYRSHGKPNLYHKNKDGYDSREEYNLRSENLYVVFSDHTMDGPSAFVKIPYRTYEDLINEFKEKLVGYLPEDFDWDKHIGMFSYAAYA